MRIFIAAVLAIAMLSGCAGSGGLIPVSDVMVNESGEIIEKTAGYTKDASIAKETAVLNAHNTRTLAKLEAYKKEGFKLEWKAVKKTYFFPGMTEPITMTEHLPEVSYKAPLVFEQPLPMEPSKHPVWGFAGKVADGVFSLGATWIKWYFGSDVVKDVWARSAPQYNGPYAPINQSYNQTAEPFFAPTM